MNNLMEDIRSNSGYERLDESILPVIFHPFKSARMIKSLMKLIREYKAAGLISKHRIKKTLGYIEMDIKGTSEKTLTYRVSITGHIPNLPGMTPKRARKARVEKMLFMGKVKSPFRVFKLRENGFYNIFEVLLETMEEDIQRDSIHKYFETEEDIEKYSKIIRSCKAITIRTKKIEAGDVNISINAEMDESVNE